MLTGEFQSFPSHPYFMHKFECDAIFKGSIKFCWYNPSESYNLNLNFIFNLFFYAFRAFNILDAINLINIIYAYYDCSTE